MSKSKDMSNKGMLRTEHLSRFEAPCTSKPVSPREIDLDSALEFVSRRRARCLYLSVRNVVCAEQRCYGPASIPTTPSLQDESRAFTKYLRDGSVRRGGLHQGNGLALRC